jgi:large subunit ribosomal protein L3
MAQPKLATRFLLGKKVGMTSIFAEDGRVENVTVIEAPASVVLRRKTKESDGYSAVQLAFGEVKEQRLTKPLQGVYKRAAVAPKRTIQEFLVPEDAEFSMGQELTVELFKPGDVIAVTSTSKGKGFQGVIKRWNHACGPMTHGSKSKRRAKSQGSTDAGRVFPGLHRPGHMGHAQVTQDGLTVVAVDAELNVVMVRGSVPGPSGSLVKLRAAK